MKSTFQKQKSNVEKSNISYKWPFTRGVIWQIEKGEYDQMNEHLPKIYSVTDYYVQVFYCIIQNDVSGLRSLINKLQELGVSLTTILNEVRTLDVGDNLLTYAVKQKKIDIVRFLLSIGATPNFDNYDGQTPLSIAIRNRSIDIAHAILAVK
ncbi:ankyrin repeat domain-containing protein [Ehrlichia minasensis]|uniref:ankyrin repeat domain-containing protein n=1 Tax=Ehrlichia minasensis TaxID=1242993 RepID=UPI0005364E0B|nr:ankyrin repeat domain-containing protein [Ehrlichia minasensis]CEI85214.1 Ankyrin [Ehrlichia minasensis]